MEREKTFLGYFLRAHLKGDPVARKQIAFQQQKMKMSGKRNDGENIS